LGIESPEDERSPKARYSIFIKQLVVLNQMWGFSWISDLKPFLIVTPRSGGYGDVTATYIRMSEIPSCIYAKHQYRQESEYVSTWYIIHSNIRVQLHSYHQM